LTGRLDAACHGPGAGQENEGIEDPDTQVQVRLRLQKEVGAPCPGHDVDDEVAGEDERLEENEGPHVRLTGHEPSRCSRLPRSRLRPDPVRAELRARDVRHRAAFSQTDGSGAASVERSGNGPVPKSSRKIILLSRVMKTVV